MQSVILGMSRKTRKTHIEKTHTRLLNTHTNTEVRRKACGTKAGQGYQASDFSSHHFSHFSYKLQKKFEYHSTWYILIVRVFSVRLPGFQVAGFRHQALGSR